MEVDLAELRDRYARTGLAESDLAADPFTQFGRWYADVRAAGVPLPEAVVVATADETGQPSARHVLLKSYDERGFVFFTNYDSRKGRELAVNPRASLLFPWYPLNRQVVIVGSAERTTPQESAAYFATRPRDSQLGAWASRQSTVVADRQALEAAYAAAEQRFAGEDVPCPPWWGGIRVIPETVEFWQNRAGRLHDRLRYRRDSGSWLIQRLSP